MTRAFVTGASGFIGSHLVTALTQRGVQVRAFVRPTSDTSHLRSVGAEIVTGGLDEPDLLREAISGVDEVYHIAGITAALRAEHMDQVNCDGTRAIARACAEQSSSPPLIVLSSIAAAGPTGRGEVRIESQPEHPASLYGRSKLRGELAAAEFCDRVPISIVRPGIVFGPRNRAMLPVLRSIKYVRVHPVPGFRWPPLSFIYVEDLIELMLCTARNGTRIPARMAEVARFRTAGAAETFRDESDPSDGIYFAVSPEYPTWAQMGRTVGRCMNRPHVLILPLAPPLPWIVAGVNEVVQKIRGKPDELNHDKMREATVESWACSPEKVRRELGFAPPKPLAQRWEETVSWYLDSAWI
jgi:nucleoside-diphosphate-sugar epimerase